MRTADFPGIDGHLAQHRNIILEFQILTLSSARVLATPQRSDNAFFLYDWARNANAVHGCLEQEHVF